MADAEYRAVPVQFWREMSKEEFRRFCDHGATKAQIRRIWELSGLDPDTAPERIEGGFRQEDIERLWPPRPGGPTLDEWLKQRRAKRNID